MASSNREIQITGHKNRINLIHAYDVANAALSAYKNEAWGVFNISSREGSTILEIAESAVSISDGGSIVVQDDNKKDAHFIRFDLSSELAKKSFGFETEINLKEGMLLMKNKVFIPC
jgi:nucleoside-diphosphate-sugar epimerase